MAGLLQFSLGLNASNFLGGLNASRGAMAALTVAGTAFTASLAGVGQAIARGAQLYDLGNRTGESISTLVKLRYAFKTVGVGAEEVTGIIGVLQRSLGGMNESGEPTAKVFETLGLSVEELKKQNAPEQLNAIFAALQKLNRSEAANAAGKIFGRGFGGSVLQAARDAEGFAQAMGHAAREAEIMGRSAGKFDQIGDGMDSIGQSIKTNFAGLAEVVAPALQTITDGVAKVAKDTEGSLGSLGSIIGQAIKKGRVSELLELSLTVGFEAAVNNFSKALQALFASLPQLLEASLANAVAQTIKSKLASPITKVGRFFGDVSELLPESNPVGQSASLLAGGFDGTAGGIKGVGDFIYKAAMKHLSDGIRTAMNTSGVDIMGDANRRKLTGLLSELTVPPVVGADDSSPKPRPTDSTGLPLDVSGKSRGRSSGGGASGAAVDALTRIGFFSGGGLSDPAARTATNTATMVQLLKQVVAQTKRANINEAAIFAGR